MKKKKCRDRNYINVWKNAQANAKNVFVYMLCIREVWQKNKNSNKNKSALQTRKEKKNKNRMKGTNKWEEAEIQSNWQKKRNLKPENHFFLQSKRKDTLANRLAIATRNYSFFRFQFNLMLPLLLLLLQWISQIYSCTDCIDSIQWHDADMMISNCMLNGRCSQWWKNSFFSL